MLLNSCGDYVSRGAYDYEISKKNELNNQVSLQKNKIEELENSLKSEQDRNKAIKFETAKSEKINEENKLLLVENQKLTKENSNYKQSLDHDVLWRLTHMNGINKIWFITLALVFLISVVLLFLNLRMKILEKNAINSIGELKNVSDKLKYQKAELNALIAQKTALNDEIMVLDELKTLHPAQKTKEIIEKAENQAQKIMQKVKIQKENLISQKQIEINTLNAEIKQLEEKIQALKELEGHF